ADPATGVATLQNNAWNNFAIGGTSLSAPMWAGLVALLDQGRDNQNPKLPRLGVNPGASWAFSVPSTDFNDVITGSAPAAANDPCVASGACAAQPGYDQVTGRGSPLLSALAADLAGTGAPSKGNLTALTPTRIM